MSKGIVGDKIHGRTMSDKKGRYLIQSFHLNSLGGRTLPFIFKTSSITTPEWLKICSYSKSKCVSSFFKQDAFKDNSDRSDFEFNSGLKIGCKY